MNVRERNGVMNHNEKSGFIAFLLFVAVAISLILWMDMNHNRYLSAGCYADKEQVVVQLLKSCSGKAYSTWDYKKTNCLMPDGEHAGTHYEVQYRCEGE